MKFRRGEISDQGCLQGDKRQEKGTFDSDTEFGAWQTSEQPCWSCGLIHLLGQQWRPWLRHPGPPGVQRGLREQPGQEPRKGSRVSAVLWGHVESRQFRFTQQVMPSSGRQQMEPSRLRAIVPQVLSQPLLAFPGTICI